MINPAIVVRLEHWAVKIEDADGYTTPELLRRNLVGEVYGHPEHRDGKRIRSTSIIAAQGRIVQTRTGRRYELGDPDPDYLAWLTREGIPFDPEHPVTVKP